MYQERTDDAMLTKCGRLGCWRSGGANKNLSTRCGCFRCLVVRFVLHAKRRGWRFASAHFLKPHPGLPYSLQQRFPSTPRRKTIQVSHSYILSATGTGIRSNAPATHPVSKMVRSSVIGMGAGLIECYPERVEEYADRQDRRQGTQSTTTTGAFLVIRIHNHADTH